MGISSSKSTTKTTPIYGKEMTGAASDITGALHAAQPGINAGMGAEMGLLPGLAQQAQNGDPTVNQARGYVGDVLGGKYLNSNPYFEDTVQRASGDIANQTSSQLGVHGNYGNSSALADIVSRNVGANENTMRSGNYQHGLGMMGQAAAMTPGLAGASQIPLQSISQIINDQQAGVRAATGAGAGVGGLLGQYTNGVTKTTPNFGQMYLQAAASAAQAFAACDERLKTDIRRVGATDAGLPIYSFRYHGENEPRMGPMAHEVAEMQPENLGPTIGGYMTVKLGSVR